MALESANPPSENILTYGDDKSVADPLDLEDGEIEEEEVQVEKVEEEPVKEEPVKEEKVEKVRRKSKESERVRDHVPNAREKGTHKNSSRHSDRSSRKPLLGKRPDRNEVVSRRRLDRAVEESPEPEDDWARNIEKAIKAVIEKEGKTLKETDVNKDPGVECSSEIPDDKEKAKKRKKKSRDSNEENEEKESKKPRKDEDEVTEKKPNPRPALLPTPPFPPILPIGDGSEELHEDEEFLYVRGASPTARGDSPQSDEYEGDFDMEDDVESWYEGSDPEAENSRSRRRRDDEGSRRRSRPLRGKRPPRGETRGRRIGGSRHSRSNPDKDPALCVFYLQGKCQKGDDCPFIHEQEQSQPKMEVCKFYLKDCCAKKDKCLYMHSEFPCKFFHTGLKCYSGEKCRFSHGHLSEALRGVLLKVRPEHIETAPKEILGDFPRMSREGAAAMVSNRKGSSRHKNEVKNIPSLFDIEVPLTVQIMAEKRGRENAREQEENWPSRRSTPIPESDAEDDNNSWASLPQTQKPSKKKKSKKRESDEEISRPRNRSSRTSEERDRDKGSRKQSRKKHKSSKRSSSTDEEEERDSSVSEGEDRKRKSKSKGKRKRRDRDRDRDRDRARDDREKPKKRRTSSKDRGERSEKPEKIEDVAEEQFYTEEPQVFAENAVDSGADSNDALSIPAHLPKKQRELFLRIQQQQREAEKRLEQQKQEEEEALDGEENWYSSDEEETPLADVLKNLSTQPSESNMSSIRQASAATALQPSAQQNPYGNLNMEELSKIDISESVSKLLSSIRQSVSANVPENENQLFSSVDDPPRNYYQNQTMPSSAQGMMTSVSSVMPSNVPTMVPSPIPTMVPPPMSAVMPLPMPSMIPASVPSMLPSTMSSTLPSTMPPSVARDPRLSSRDPRSRMSGPATTVTAVSQANVNPLLSPNSSETRRPDLHGTIGGGRRNSNAPSIYSDAIIPQTQVGDVDLRSFHSTGDIDARVERQTGDVDLRIAATPFRDLDLRVESKSDVDLRNMLGLPFKPIPVHTPATEINASFMSHPPMVWKLIEVMIPRPDFSKLKVNTGDPQVYNDPRLRKIFRLGPPPTTSTISAVTTTSRNDPRRQPSQSFHENAGSAPVPGSNFLLETIQKAMQSSMAQSFMAPNPQFRLPSFGGGDPRYNRDPRSVGNMSVDQMNLGFCPPTPRFEDNDGSDSEMPEAFGGNWNPQNQRQRQKIRDFIPHSSRSYTPPL